MDSPPTFLRFTTDGPTTRRHNAPEDPIVISGIGIAASLGSSREAVWQAVQAGSSGIRLTGPQDGVGSLRLPCGMVDWLPPEPASARSIKSIRLCRWAAAEALDDADIDWRTIDKGRFACSLAAQFGDIGYLYLTPQQRAADPQTLEHAWHNEFLPCSISDQVAAHYQLYGPRMCYATACATGLISVLSAARMIQEDQADMALAGGGDSIHEIVLAAFHRMGVLAQSGDPAQACRPFDRQRQGFVMGEGAALMVLEKRSHALARGAQIYAEITASQLLCQAHHVTSLENDCDTLEQLIRRTLQRTGWNAAPQYINAHGTGTTQNDLSELYAIRQALGADADSVVASSNKAVLGHMINAAGSIELALSALSMRDGFAPPTMHLTDPESVGGIDCLPEFGVVQPLKRVLKISQAFGGHLAAVALTQPEQACRAPLPLSPVARIRTQVNQLHRVA